MSMIGVDYGVLNQRGSPSWFSDIYANIPTAGYKGRMFISIDTYAFYRDTGTGWDLIGGPGTGTITGSGTSGQVSYFNGLSTLAGSNNLFWDNTNSRLGINTTTPGVPLDIHGTGTNAQFNGTGTNNAYLVFQNAGASKWRIGNTYNAGANSFDIYNNGLTNTPFSISSTTNAITLASNVTTTGAQFVQNALYVGYANGGATALYTNMYGSTNGINFGLANGTGGANFIFQTANGYNYTFPAATGTIALVGGSGVGTVTSVAAITLGTTGTDLSSSVANSTTTPVITLNVPTASATNRGALSSADWTTFNNKQATITNPITGTGATGQVAYWSGTSTQTGNNNLFWDNTNARLGINTIVPNAGVTSYSTTASTQFKAAGTSAGITFTDTVVSPTYASAIGIATAVNNFVTGTAIGDMGIVNQSTTPGAIVFGIGSLNEKARISSSGNLLVGSATDSGSYKLDVTGAARIITNASSTGLTLNVSNTGTYGLIGVSRGTQTAASAGINFYTTTAQKWFIGMSESTDNFNFYNVNLATSPLFISNSTGNVSINGTGFSDVKFYVKGSDATSSNYACLFVNGSASNLFSIRNDGIVTIHNIGTGTVTATSGVLSAVSDMHLKIEDGFIDNGLDKVLKLKPRYFYWKEESSLPTNIRQLGFYAQEVNAALGEESANTPINKDDKWGIYDRGIIAMLTKAIQELNEKLVRNNIN